MISRYLIISLIFAISRTSFAGNNRIPSLKSDNNGLCEDTISHLGKFLPRSDWPNFVMGTSSTIDEVNDKLSRAKTFVYLNKDLDAFKKVIDSNQLNEVTGFFHPYFTKRVDQNSLIKLWGQENTRKLVLKEWEQETINAAREDREPYYLPLISKLVALELKKFLEDTKQKILSKNQENKHAFSLFFSMTAYNYYTWDAVEDAASDAFRHDARGYLRDAFQDAAWDTSRDDVWDVAMDAAWDLSYETSKEAGEDAARDAIDSAVEQSKDNDPEFMGKLAYRVAEKTVLLHFLDKFADIVRASYEASIEVMETVPQPNIFESQIKWSEFKTRHFGKIMNNPELNHFLEFWLNKLDGVVDIIEGPIEPARKKQKT